MHTFAFMFVFTGPVNGIRAAARERLYDAVATAMHTRQHMREKAGGLSRRDNSASWPHYQNTRG